jgi:hypothetical protein
MRKPLKVGEFQRRPLFNQSWRKCEPETQRGEITGTTIIGTMRCCDMQ